MRKIFLILWCSVVMVSAKLPKEKIGVVIASFGTTHSVAVKSIINVKEAVKKKFPQMDVRIAFTSNIIRRIWQNRANDIKYRVEHKDVPEFLYRVKTPLATIADLQNEGVKTIVVQSTHIYAGEEYSDLCSMVDGLNSIKTEKKKFMPFKKLLIGRPALGEPGTLHDYKEDIKIAAKALEKDVNEAKQSGSILVYMGHGNDYFSTGVYSEIGKVLRKTYEYEDIFLGCVEGFPSLDDVLEDLRGVDKKKIILKPLMLVAGDHANNDMAGEDKDSWKSILESRGFSVDCKIEGLGMNQRWVDIYVSHLEDALHDAGIKTQNE